MDITVFEIGRLGSIVSEMQLQLATIPGRGDLVEVDGNGYFEVLRRLFRTEGSVELYCIRQANSYSEVIRRDALDRYGRIPLDD